MKIDLYSLCWNEMRLLPFFIRHYYDWVDRIILFDDRSTDGSVEYLRTFSKVEVREKPRPVADSMVGSNLEVYDSCWKESRGRADWVIVTNIDEHLFHPNLMGLLADSRASGVTLIPGLGCQMVTEEFPSGNKRLCDIVTCGTPFPRMSKLSLFNPNAIEATHYTFGRHVAAPTGDVRYPAVDELLNLHFKYLGLNYLLERYSELKTGLLARDIEDRLGYHYLLDRRAIIIRFKNHLSRAREIGPDSVEMLRNACAPLWWRVGEEKREFRQPAVDPDRSLHRLPAGRVDHENPSPP